MKTICEENKQLVKQAHSLNLNKMKYWYIEVPNYLNKNNSEHFSGS